MKNNSLTSFFSSMIVIAVMLGLFGLYYLYLTFNLAGGETLNQIENQNTAQLIISFLLLTLAIFCARYYIKKSKSYTAYGIIALPLVIFFASVFYFFGHNFYHVEFDKKVWEQSKRKPEKMAKTLVKEKALIGLSKMQLKEMLGEGFTDYRDLNAEISSISYIVKNDWTLTIFFQKDKVIDTELRLPFLGV